MVGQSLSTLNYFEARLTTRIKGVAVCETSTVSVVSSRLIVYERKFRGVYVYTVATQSYILHRAKPAC